ncbi:hypothetical protein HYDPIDRAFT_110223 [Hydnomerulius pinastri MD-312]|nr:hypothetical protein HYDPIDRAFT_110223 [Hydnomerulius pinastri MD-312]
MPLSPDNTISPNALYIVAFAQTRAPHVGLLIPDHPTSTVIASTKPSSSPSANMGQDNLGPMIAGKYGCLVHIRIDESTGPNWVYQCRRQRIKGEMGLVGMLMIHIGDPNPKPIPDASVDGDPGLFESTVDSRLGEELNTKTKTPNSNPITPAQLKSAAEAVPVPANDTFGECSPWVMNVVKELHRRGLLVLKESSDSSGVEAACSDGISASGPDEVSGGDTLVLEKEWGAFTSNGGEGLGGWDIKVLCLMGSGVSSGTVAETD